MKNPEQKQQADKELKEYFQSLNLKEWTATGNIANGGQADIIELKNNKTRQLGVFRTLRRKEENDINRFYRELEILTKTKTTNGILARKVTVLKRIGKITLIKILMTLTQYFMKQLESWLA